MSNSNMEPLPFRRPFGGLGSSGSRTLAELAATVAAPQDEDAFVDVSGLAKVRQAVTGACRKCGYPGHLPFQCRNYIQLKPGQSTVIDVSSTSSESSDGETPLVEKAKKKHKKKKSKKERKKKKKHRKDSSSSSDVPHRKEKSRRKRRHSSSPSDQERRSKKKKKH